MTETQRRALRLLARPGAYAFRPSSSVLWNIGTEMVKWRKVSGDTLWELEKSGLVHRDAEFVYTITDEGRAQAEKERHA